MANTTTRTPSFPRFYTPSLTAPTLSSSSPKKMEEEGIGSIAIQGYETVKESERKKNKTGIKFRVARNS